jgi:hypothetical protein
LWTPIFAGIIWKDLFWNGDVSFKDAKALVLMLGLEETGLAGTVDDLMVLLVSKTLERVMNDIQNVSLCASWRRYVI